MSERLDDILPTQGIDYGSVERKADEELDQIMSDEDYDRWTNRDETYAKLEDILRKKFIAGTFTPKDEQDWDRIQQYFQEKLEYIEKQNALRRYEV